MFLKVAPVELPGGHSHQLFEKVKYKHLRLNEYTKSLLLLFIIMMYMHMYVHTFVFGTLCATIKGGLMV